MTFAAILNLLGRVGGVSVFEIAVDCRRNSRSPNQPVNNHFVTLSSILTRHQRRW
ncbi:hypothetical protein PPACK8108_LOCUS7367, partial [Phakopsora pachyrhizi]